MSHPLLDEFPETTPGHDLTDIPIVGLMGLQLLAAERGRCVLRLPFEPNVNHVGMVYAGSIFTLAEAPGGVLFVGAFDMSRFYPIVGDMSVRFRRPARTALLVDARMSDELIERATADLEANGKAKWVLEQDILDADGEVVATTSATYFGMSF